MFTSDDWGPDRMMDGSYGHGMTSGGVWMMVLFGLLFVLLAAATIFLVIRAADRPTDVGRGAGAGAAPGTPRDVLDLRLARGEITPEEYGATRTLLEP